MILLFGVFLLTLASGAKERKKACVETHALNEETGLCDWTGPKDACVQLVDYWNRSYFLSMPNFPNNKFREVDLKARNSFMDDYAVKVIVRRGCMFTGYSYPRTGDGYQYVTNGENLVYGAYKLNNYMTRECNDYLGGLTRPTCLCDPTEATVNGHVPSPPPDRKCVDLHEFDEDTQQCEWKLEPKFCAEVRTVDNRKKLLEIPNWPEKRKYDVNHYMTRGGENFHITVTNIVVRQHCFATLLWEKDTVHQWKTMPTMGYGHHVVASKDNNLATAGFGGTGRFICECIR